MEISNSVLMYALLISGILMGISLTGLYHIRDIYKKEQELKKIKYILSKIGESFSNFGYQRDNFKLDGEANILLNKKNAQVIKTFGILFKELYDANAINSISDEDLKIVLDILHTSTNGVDIDNGPIETLANIYHNKRI
jgi:hypothetical protein